MVSVMVRVSAEVAGGVLLVFREARCCPVMACEVVLRRGLKRLVHPVDPVRWAAPHRIHDGVQGWFGWGASVPQVVQRFSVGG